MKITLRGMGAGRFVRKLESRRVADLVGGIHTDLFFDATWPSDNLEEFLRESAKYGSFDLNPWMTFTHAEIEQARFVSVRPSKVIEETNAQYEKMRREIDALPWICKDPARRCRLPQRIYLSTIKLRPNQVAVVGQWTSEYVLPNAVRQIFEDAKLTGAEFRPVIHSRSGAPIDGFSPVYRATVGATAYRCRLAQDRIATP